VAISTTLTQLNSRRILHALLVLGGIALSFTAGVSEAKACRYVSPITSRCDQTERRMVVLDNQIKVYTEVTHGRPGFATFVLVGDLASEISSLDLLTSALNSKGYTVIRYAYSGQIESMRLLSTSEEPAFFAAGLTQDALVTELAGVLKSVGIHEQQKFNLVGFGFGAMIAANYAATHPDRVDELALISPLVSSIDYYDPEGRGLRVWLTNIRFWENAPCSWYGVFNPSLCTATDNWYDAFYNSLYTGAQFGPAKTPPAGIDPVVYKKSLFHLLRVSRDFDLRYIAYGLKNVHMMLAGKDSPELAAAQESAWRMLGKKERRSLVIVRGADHDIEKVASFTTAKWLISVAQKATGLQKGDRIEVDIDTVINQ
jgi:pimeloyl-ACP methyl ester carboxylesterase